MLLPHTYCRNWWACHSVGWTIVSSSPSPAQFLRPWHRCCIRSLLSDCVFCPSGGCIEEEFFSRFDCCNPLAMPKPVLEVDKTALATGADTAPYLTPLARCPNIRVNGNSGPQQRTGIGRSEE